MALDFRPGRPRPPTQAESPDDANPPSEASICALAPSSEHDPRREHSRFSVELNVTVGSDHNFYAGFAENLSAGGVFIATHKLKPVGSAIELSITLPDGARLKANGEVRWVRVFNEQSDAPPGMGVRFFELDSQASAAIERFLQRREPLFFDED